MKPRPSDRIGSHASLFDDEFEAWCEAVLELWKRDPQLHAEFVSVIHFFDFANDVAEQLIRSAWQG